MKTFLTVYVMAVSIVAFAGDEAPCKVDLELADGGKVIGTMKRERLKISRKATGAIEIPVQSIELGERLKNGDGFRLKLQNGDLVTGDLVDKAYTVQTIIGPITVKPRQVVGIRVVKTKKDAPKKN